MGAEAAWVQVQVVLVLGHVKTKELVQMLVLVQVNVKTKVQLTAGEG